MKSSVKTSNAFWKRSNILYKSTLMDKIIPFWMLNGKDNQFGGISNVLDDTGLPLSHDKFIWSQGRGLWTFSALYNRIEKRKEWLEFADHIYNYLIKHGRDAEGRWMFRLDAQGKVLERDISIYADGFVLNGLGEYFIASKNSKALDLALSTSNNILNRLAQPGSYQIAPYTIPPGFKTHGIAMIFSFFFYNLGEIAKNEEISKQGLEYAQSILKEFYQPTKNAILEFVTLEGQFSDNPQGRVCVPGHALEGLWFLITIFERSGQYQFIPQCCQLIRRHLELGWDKEYGGLFLAVDIEGIAPVFWKHPDCKPWWVQLEALVATTYAFYYTKEDWCVEWHERIQEYAFNHYPVKTGEWTQWLDRTGNPRQSAALPVKDPFHLPRALIYMINLIEDKLE